MSEREVIRCPHCRLNQFMTRLGHCRRCRKALVAKEDPPPLMPIVVVVTESAKGEPGAIDAAARDVCKMLRLAFDLSQRDVALRMRVPRTQISKIERVESGLLRPAERIGTPGRTRGGSLTLAMVQRMAAAFAVPAEVLVILAEFRMQTFARRHNGEGRA